MKSFERNIVKSLIDYAKYLLVNTTKPLENIAKSCGWADLESFTEFFQKEVGVTPHRYRQWHHDSGMKVGVNKRFNQKHAV